MSKHLQRDLESLERDILAQSSVVEEMIRVACRGLCGRRAGVVEELAKHEPGVNSREVQIEEECLKLLALHQPVAGDLRRVATVLKVNSDLERIADLAVNVGNRTASIAEHDALPACPAIEKMVDATIAMVRDALDALVDLDVDRARAVCARDDQVDDYNREVIQQLSELMRTRSELVEPALHFFSASRHIERIADHATNIAEDVIYLVEGAITRHGGDAPEAEDSAEGERAGRPGGVSPLDPVATPRRRPLLPEQEAENP